jgi:phage-related tail fiber protein
MSQTYYAILTALGEAKLANAAALNQPLQISKMAVGDGNGSLPNPDRTQTALVRETYRANLNTLQVDPANSSQVIAELVIPETVGGWWIRELGLYDAAGTLVAVANCPPSYKPQLAEGSGRTQVLRMVLVVSSTSTVELKVDPSVVLATRSFVEQRLLEELNKQDFKHSVLAATTAPVTLSGIQTLDGVALTVGARVLVKNQPQARDNGIYLVSASGWNRAPDADASAEVTPGLLVHVEKGTAHGDSVWQLVSDAPITLGSTDLIFEMMAGPSGVTVGTYRSVTVDRYGRVIAATNPTSLEGYGIAIASQADAEAGDAADNTRPMTSFRVFQSLRSAAANATETLRGVLRIGTQAEVTAGVLDNVTVTPKTLRAGVNLLLGATGYIALPTWLGGLILQWGRASNGAAGPITVTFPVTFPNSKYAEIALPVVGVPLGWDTSQSNGALNRSAAVFARRSGNGSSSSGDSNFDVYWLAIGK